MIFTGILTHFFIQLFKYTFLKTHILPFLHCIAFAFVKQSSILHLWRFPSMNIWDWLIRTRKCLFITWNIHLQVFAPLNQESRTTSHAFVIESVFFINFLQALHRSDGFLLSCELNTSFLKKRERFSMYLAQDFVTILAPNISSPLTTFLSLLEKNQLERPWKLDALFFFSIVASNMIISLFVSVHHGILFLIHPTLKELSSWLLHSDL